MKVIFINKKIGHFFSTVPEVAKPRMRRAFEMLEERGYALGMPLSKALGGNLFELRILGTHHIRFIYAFYEDKIVVLHGFIKKTDRIPKKDLEYAEKCLKMFLQ